MRGLASGVVALALTLAPTSAAAWCRLPGDYAGYWTERFPELRIPVYLAVGEQSNVLYTQLTRAQMAAIVQRVIAVHNETVATPTLYYAGETEAELDAEGGSGGAAAGDRGRVLCVHGDRRGGELRGGAAGVHDAGRQHTRHGGEDAGDVPAGAV